MHYVAVQRLPSSTDRAYRSPPALSFDLNFLASCSCIRVAIALEYNTSENNQSFMRIYVARTPIEHNAPNNIQREIVTFRVEYSTVQRFC